MRAQPARYHLSPSHLKDASLAGLAVAGQGFVRSEVIQGVMPGPALLTEVLEAADTATEQWSRVPVTGVTDTVLQVRLDLDLK